MKKLFKFDRLDSKMGGPSISAVTRLKKDYQKLINDPVPYAIAVPLCTNILEWHYVVIGAPDTPYDGRNILALMYEADNL